MAWSTCKESFAKNLTGSEAQTLMVNGAVFGRGYRSRQAEQEGGRVLELPG